MQEQFSSTELAECVINIATGEVSVHGEVFTLRPKTFELLVLLASKEGQLVSKQEILDTIWGDSVVEDQVVFQSINEIRKLLPMEGSVKTYPRRGYCWLVKGTTWSPSPHTSAVNDSGSASVAEKVGVSPWRVKVSLPSVVVFGLFLVILAWYSLQQEQETQQTHQGILVLPFDVNGLADNNKWVKFSAMQDVIRQIPRTDSVTVFQLEDVLEILNRLPKEQQVNNQQLFEKSGASIIFHVELSGSPGDYHAILSVTTEQHSVRNVLTAQTLDQATQQIVTSITDWLPRQNKVNFVSSPLLLQNELVIKGIQFFNSGDFDSAQAFFQSAVVNDKTDLIAWYNLIKVDLQRGNFKQVESSITTMKASVSTGEDSVYLSRLGYMQGVSLLAQGQLAPAKTALLDASQQATAQQDWLYLAYSHAMLGKLYQVQQQFSEAKGYLQRAMRYQQLLDCPMGMATGHLDLAELFLLEQNIAEATHHVSLAENMIHRNELKSLQASLQKVRYLVSSHTL